MSQHMARTSISIPASLLVRLDRFADRINRSEIARRALEAEVERLEAEELIAKDLMASAFAAGVRAIDAYPLGALPHSPDAIKTPDEWAAHDVSALAFREGVEAAWRVRCIMDVARTVA